MCKLVSEYFPLVGVKENVKQMHIWGLYRTVKEHCAWLLIGKYSQQRQPNSIKQFNEGHDAHGSTPKYQNHHLYHLNNLNKCQ